MSFSFRQRRSFSPSSRLISSATGYAIGSIPRVDKMADAPFKSSTFNVPVPTLNFEPGTLNKDKLERAFNDLAEDPHGRYPRQVMLIGGSTRLAILHAIHESAAEGTYGLVE